MKRKLIQIQIDRRSDQRGVSVYVNGIRSLAFHHWRIWRYERRELWGWVFKLRLPSRIARGSAAWCALPLWQRVVHPPNWMRRTLYIGWRARGGESTYGPWRTLRCGFACMNATPYSFR